MYKFMTHPFTLIAFGVCMMVEVVIAPGLQFCSSLAAGAIIGWNTGRIHTGRY